MLLHPLVGLCESPSPLLHEVCYHHSWRSATKPHSRLNTIAEILPPATLIRGILHPPIEAASPACRPSGVYMSPCGCCAVRLPVPSSSVGSPADAGHAVNKNSLALLRPYFLCTGITLRSFTPYMTLCTWCSTLLSCTGQILVASRGARWQHTYEAAALVKVWRRCGNCVVLKGVLVQCLARRDRLHEAGGMVSAFLSVQHDVTCSAQNNTAQYIHSL